MSDPDYRSWIDPYQQQQQQQQQELHRRMQQQNELDFQRRERERRERIARGEQPADGCCLIVFVLLMLGAVAGVLSIVL